MPGQVEGADDLRSWLLDPAEPGVRYLALRDWVGLGEGDPELEAARESAHREGPIAGLLAAMDPAGFWSAPGPGYNPKYRSTVWSVVLLAQLGARVEADERVAKACAYVLDHALTPRGQFTSSGAPSGTVDCLQGNLCRALVDLGVDDPRLERAFDWLARTVTGEGIAPITEKAAPERYYAGKCGPGFACGANDKLPCAWGAVKVLRGLAAWPVQRRSLAMARAIRVGVDFLLGVDPATAAYPSGYTGKPSGSWWKFGFPVFYVTDILQVVETLVELGHGQDPRLARARDLVRSKRDDHGRWPLEYDYAGKTWLDFGPKRQPNKWVTLRALRALDGTD